MMKRFKALLFMMAMALAIVTWAGWSPAIATGEVDTAVEETMDQVEETADEEWNYQEESEAETQEESPYTD